MDFEESGLKFCFPSSWIVSKYDDSDFYRKKAEKLNNTKGVDFLSCKKDSVNRKILFFIEVKNFSDYRGENRNRLKLNDNDSVYIEIAQKVRDTIAGLIGAKSFSEQEDCKELDAFYSLLTSKKANCQNKIKVIAFIEGSISSYKTRRDNGLKAIQNKLEKLLSWISCEVLVLNSDKMQKRVFHNVPFSVIKMK